jgi:hypothetical protein
VARLLYNENYVALPMSHQVSLITPAISVDYRWQHQEAWHTLRATANEAPVPPQPGSLEEFITEHYWGYVTQRGGGCMEYQVEHPRWKVWRASEASLQSDIASLYDPKFAPFFSGPPASAFIADGSAVTVYRGRELGR